MTKSAASIGYVVGTYPLLTTRFVDREIRAMRDLGAVIEVVSLRRPTGELSDDQVELANDVTYLMPARVLEVLSAVLQFSWRPQFLRLALRLVASPHPSWRARVKTVIHLGQGLAATRLFADTGITHVHAHFVDRAAIVAIVVSKLMNIEYSATAHANDIYVNPVLLEAKVDQAKFISTCTRFNHTHLLDELGDSVGEKIVVDYHGLDTARYEQANSNGDPVVRVLAIGQLKEKKGFTYLIEAIRLLRDEGRHAVHLDIVGAGPLEAELREQVSAAGLDGTVELLGSLRHPEVVRRLSGATTFVMSSVLAADGDRDGIPNVILEAMASGVPVVGTSVSGLPEVVRDERTGLLVEPNSATALADAIRRLADDVALRTRLAENAKKLVLESFDTQRNAMQLLDRFIGAAS